MPLTATELVDQLQGILDLLRASVAVPVHHTVTVKVGDSIQAAIDAAVDGTEIRIQPGVYPCNLILRAGKSGIVIRSDVADPVLTLPWVTPALVNGGWAILTPRDPLTAIIATEPGAHDYTLRCLEIGPNLAHPERHLLYLGDFAQTTLDQVPARIHVDRCYIHGSDVSGGLRGISLNTRESTISGCYLSNFWFRGQDSQAIGIYTGPGPFLIDANYLEGSGENILVGGVDAKNADMVPSDLIIRNNYFFKPLAWKTKPGSVKNLLELKGARRVLIESNVLENSWIDAQVGHGIVLTVRNQDGQAPWTTIADVVVRGNIIKNVQGSAFNLLGLDDNFNRPSVQGVNLTITGNLILGAGRGMQSSAGFQPTVMTHNTLVGATNAAIFLYFRPWPANQFTLADNVLSGGLYGIIGDVVGSGTPAFTTFAPGATVGVNVLEGIGTYPPAIVRLLPGSLPSKLDANLQYTGPELASDGGKLGADVAALKGAMPWATIP